MLAEVADEPHQDVIDALEGMPDDVTKDELGGKQRLGLPVERPPRTSSAHRTRA